MNKSVSLESLTLVHPNAAGLDIGSREIWVAVRPDLDGKTVRCCATFTPDLVEALADWLLACGVDTVVMESTGVYWIPAFELFEARGIQCCLVNARHVKHVPGRKSDVQNCQWLQKLHSLGLLFEVCNAEIEQQYAAIPPRWDAPDDLLTLPPVKPGSKSKNQPAATRQELFRITGVDLVAVEGISASLAQTIISEIGTDMFRFPTARHFCSWLGLAPHHDISGGKVLRSRTLKTDNRAGQAFRQAAAVTRSDSAFGAFYRRKRAQIGPLQALVATAHKIARTVYYMLKRRVAYHDIGAQGYETQQRERELTCLQRKAAKLGFELTPKQAAVPS